MTNENQASGSCSTEQSKSSCSTEESSCSTEGKAKLEQKKTGSCSTSAAPASDEPSCCG